jgi:hypothetical protein
MNAPLTLTFTITPGTLPHPGTSSCTDRLTGMRAPHRCSM